ncbi:Uma2 family endonuclease [Microcoleus sp. Pol12A6]|uniref:Uma2 family endonuclease n=1 Tax=Microcoleus sp. Pol12A6 TaxID=3055393 RepID=UPI002FD098AC
MGRRGIIPDFVLEITSETTQTKDQETKQEIYRALGVREYFQYDPSGDYLNPIVQGVRLINNQYEPIVANNIAFDTLWLFSEVLGLELHLISGELRFRVPETGEFLKTHKEENQGRLAAELTLRQLVTQVLNSGMSREQVAQMMNLSTVEVQRLVGENF